MNHNRSILFFIVLVLVPLSKCCSICPIGTISDPVNCQNCWKGFCTNIKDCRTCENGFYSSSNRSICIPCEKGFENNQEHSGCVECQLGYFNSKMGSRCLACASGHYSPMIAMTACDKCPKGSYQNKPATWKCNACGKGKTTDNKGSKQDSDCVSCNEGTYCNKTINSGDNVCPKNYKCPAGCSNPIKCSLIRKSQKGMGSCALSVEFFLILFSTIGFIVLVVVAGIIRYRKIQERKKFKRPDKIEYYSDFSKLEEKRDLVPKPQAKEVVYSGF
ncbi:hypothetical protein M0812_26263 [Anaeramoeba flamelloides]|uniref:Tyrosine-protein kinase ephrin type A/B receptor-like domain-containing protein n=1 Tax=Anaeramoeba flamelloides TaxID=1746091 RepID=A0AAV7YCN9_9EUKA|nr:hypothetical protein M0812_26263 [Anaeramoeba flamelloides]